jgi:hypothetical protein
MSKSSVRITEQIQFRIPFLSTFEIGDNFPILYPGMKILIDKYPMSLEKIGKLSEKKLIDIITSCPHLDIDSKLYCQELVWRDGL